MPAVPWSIFPKRQPTMVVPVEVAFGSELPMPAEDEARKLLRSVFEKLHVESESKTRAMRSCRVEGAKGA
jgi:hypothetical protein